MLEKPVIAALVGNFKHEILKTFEVKTTLPDLDKRLFPLIFPHTLGKLVLVEGENPEIILLPRLIMEGIRGEVCDRTITQFLGLVTVERNVFRPFNERFLARLGVGLVFRPGAGYQKITDASGMNEWRWLGEDLEWTHKLYGYPFDYPVVTVIPPRLTIRAFDVDWGPGIAWWWERRHKWTYWEHNLVHADRYYIGTMRGTPPRRWNNAWSVSKFDIPCHLLEDGRVTIRVNIDSSNTQRTWGVIIDWAKLEWGLAVEIYLMAGKMPDDKDLERIATRVEMAIPSNIPSFSSRASGIIPVTPRLK